MVDYRHILDTYGSISILSGEMLKAAKSGDWERLAELERDCRALLDTLSRDDAGERRAARPDLGYIQRKYELIRKVLADDAQIRRYTEPWMDKLPFFQGAARKEQSALRHSDSGCRSPV